MTLLYMSKERAPMFVEPARRPSLSSASRLLAAPPTFAPCMRQTVDLRIHWELHDKVECALGVGKFDYFGDSRTTGFCAFATIETIFICGA
jgi:hypothetical protein